MADYKSITKQLVRCTMHRHRNTRKALILSCLLFCFSLLPLPVHGDDGSARLMGTMTLHLENDVFYDTDRGYTQGLKLSWASPDLRTYRDHPLVPEWSTPLIERLPLVNQTGDLRYVSFAFGQNMYTPSDTGGSNLIRDDRPYAGVLYLAVAFHGRDDRRMDTLEFDVGIVGPHSYAEDCQKAYHKWIDVGEPKGWKHQLHDEPILNAFFERKWRLWRPENVSRWGYDCIPYIGGGVGNAFIGANVGGEFRFGWHLPDDFGTFLIAGRSGSNVPFEGADPHPSRRFGIHCFLALEGTAVARNILLDGNTFRDSHSVEKEPFVAGCIGGVGISIGRLKVTYAYVYRTKEFETQDHDQEYGSISLSYTF